MSTIGMHFGHDAGIALTQSGGYLSIEAERRLGVRHVCAGNPGFPDEVAGWLDELRSHSAASVANVAVADWYTPVCQILPPSLVELVGGDAEWATLGGSLADNVMRRINCENWPLASALGEITLTAVRHHFAHAAVAYYTSGKRRALVVVLDGTGNYAECGMVCLGEDDQLTPVMSFNNRSGPRFGLIYEALARRVHGGQFDTGKLLGLSATGTPDPALLPVLRAMLVPQSSRLESPDLYEKLDEEMLAGTALRYQDTWWKYDPGSGGYLDAGLADSSDDDVVYSFSSVFPDEILTADAQRIVVGREPEDQTCRNVAATLQAAIEQDLTRLVAGISGRFPGYTTLCYGGGCALNIIANTRLVESGRFTRVYIPTCCDDSGIALGAALAAAAPEDRPAIAEQAASVSLAYAGPPLGGEQAFAEQADDVAGLVHASDQAARWRRFPSRHRFIHETARILADQGCVAWLEGGMETGPRALGHRSLLVSAHWSGARRYVSETIKGREWFRPVAPLCPEELADQYFTGPLDHTETMLFAVRVRTDQAERLAEASHFDGTARLQTVRSDVHSELHRLCHAVGGLTGLPVLINTSANGVGKPILNGLDEALALLFDTELDAIALPEHRIIIQKLSGMRSCRSFRCGLGRSSSARRPNNEVDK